MNHNKRHLVELRGRLGNLLFQVALGVALEVRTGISWAALGNLDDDLRRTLEAWTGPLSWADEGKRTDMIGGPGLAGKAWRWLQKRMAFRWRTWVVQQTSGFEPRHLQVTRAALWLGYWQSLHYFADQGAAVRQALVFRGALPAILVSFEALARQGDSISIHVRRGDYLTSPGFGALDVEFYRRALSELPPRGPLLVFSDDPDWCRAQLDLGRPFTVVEGGRPEEDLYLMSLCHHHVIAYSTFSWWGAWLGQRAGGRVVAPARWFASFEGEPALTDIYPPNWEILPSQKKGIG